MGPTNSSGTPDTTGFTWSSKNIVTSLQKDSSSDLDDFIVIGIDFGTTCVICDLILTL